MFDICDFLNNGRMRNVLDFLPFIAAHKVLKKIHKVVIGDEIPVQLRHEAFNGLSVR